MQHCSVYGRIICQVQTLGFKSLEIATADHCSQKEPDLSGVITQSDSTIKTCQFLNETSTSVDCLQMNIFVSLSCEQTNATVIPVLGWTLGDNTEYYCIYIRPPEPLSHTGK